MFLEFEWKHLSLPNLLLPYILKDWFMLAEFLKLHDRFKALIGEFGEGWGIGEHFSFPEVGRGWGIHCLKVWWRQMPHVCKAFWFALQTECGKVRSRCASFNSHGYNEKSGCILQYKFSSVSRSCLLLNNVNWSIENYWRIQYVLTKSVRFILFFHEYTWTFCHASEFGPASQQP